LFGYDLFVYCKVLIYGLKIVGVYIEYNINACVHFLIKIVIYLW